MARPHSETFTDHLYRIATWSLDMDTISSCPWNCSGRGICQDGECVCLVQFSGGSCKEANIGYFIAFGSIFISLGAVVLLQLMLCIGSDYLKEGRKSLFSACRPSIQKTLYALVICACAIRGAYFFTKWQVMEDISHTLWNAYYPILLSASCLIICFWAEAFHLRNVRCDSPRLLSKSLIAFIVFNIINYVLLFTQLLVTELVTDENLKELVLQICSYIFAAMMLVVVIFFLIYGVEVFFKVHGAFILAEMKQNVDPWQLHMSRLGLVVQAVLQLITAFCVVADLIGENWRNKLPILSQNFYDIIWRIVEFGVALWFPCVLWNCRQPEKLWVLNPRRLLLDFQWELDRGETAHVYSNSQTNYESVSDASVVAENQPHDCWICYDSERKDAGPLIQPCLCKGDVAFVHHDCLKKWLIESVVNGSSAKCKVCNQKYKLEGTYSWVPRFLKPCHWLQTFLLIMFMVGCPFAAYAVVHSVTSTYIRMIAIGGAIVAEILIIKFSCNTFQIFYRKLRVSSMQIIGKSVNEITAENNSTLVRGTAGNDVQCSVTISSSSIISASDHLEICPGLLQVPSGAGSRVVRNEQSLKTGLRLHSQSDSVSVLADVHMS